MFLIRYIYITLWCPLLPNSCKAFCARPG